MYLFPFIQQIDQLAVAQPDQIVATQKLRTVASVESEIYATLSLRSFSSTSLTPYHANHNKIQKQTYYRIKLMQILICSS